MFYIELYSFFFLFFLSTSFVLSFSTFLEPEQVCGNSKIQVQTAVFIAEGAVHLQLCQSANPNRAVISQRNSGRDDGGDSQVIDLF